MSDQDLNTTQDMLPIEDFAKAKQIETAKCIQMVRDGFYDGRLINGAWSVSTLELDARQERGRGDQTRKTSRAKPRRRGKAHPKRPGGLPDMALFLILMVILALLTSLILVLTYWPGSTAYPDHLNLDGYREPILWGLGGVVVASLFAALAQIIHYLSLLVNATKDQGPSAG